MEDFMAKTSEIIYEQRKQKYLTQEQLAQEIGVSSVAVSKWERGISIPDQDILCRLADYFKITVDELLGRQTGVIEENDVYTKEFIRRLHFGEILLGCCEISRKEGLLAMEYYPGIEEGSFLRFAVNFVLDSFQKQLQPEFIFELLRRYTENEEDKKTAYMIADVLQYIISGESEGIIREVIASYMGRNYRNHFVNITEEKKKLRKDILAFYKEKEQKSETVCPLEEFLECSDEKIQYIIKNIENNTFVAALSGASNQVCVKFLSNLSDRLLCCIDEDIRQYRGTKEEIAEAQKKILKVSENFLQK